MSERFNYAHLTEQSHARSRANAAIEEHIRAGTLTPETASRMFWTLKMSRGSWLKKEPSLLHDGKRELPHGNGVNDGSRRGYRATGSSA